jgi:translation elongation factor EF-1beta
VKAVLVNDFPTSGVTAKDGAVFVKIEIPLSQQEKTMDAIKRIAENIEGVKEVDVYATPLLGVD